MSDRLMIDLLAAEIKRLMDCLELIRRMAESRKTVIRMPDDSQLGNFCERHLSGAHARLSDLAFYTGPKGKL